MEENNLYQQLAHFRSMHTYHKHDIAGITWKYLVGGPINETALLLLPGAPGLAEMAFQHMQRFESSYHVLSLNYPAGVTTMAALVDGIVALLDHEQIDSAFVLGGSYSGMVAQCLLRRYPQKVSKLILDHTSPPSREKTWSHTLYYLLLAWLPLVCIRCLLTCGTYPARRHKNPAVRFWGDYFKASVIATLTKEDYISRIQTSLDYYQNYTFERTDVMSWSGSILIIEADNDSYVPAKARTALKDLYPTAQVYTFHHTGHAAWATEAATFFAVIAHFLEEK